MRPAHYPFFLKLTAMNTWYEVTNDHSFTEVKTLGKFYSVTKYADDILPMRNHIMDLAEGAEEVSVEMFNDYLEKLKQEKTLRDF